MKALVVLVLLLTASGAFAEEDVLNMRQINEMCGPKYGHKDWVDQTECILVVLPRSNNQNAEIEQARMDRYCSAAAKSVEDTCSIQTKNPKGAIGLCATTKVLYFQQGCR